MTVDARRCALDLDTARRHLAALEHADAGFIFAAFAEASGSRARPRHIVGRLRDVADTLAAAQGAGCGVFVTVNAMRGRRRRKAEVARVRAVWAERDRPGRDLPLPPSLVVATSPGRRHDYWLISPSDPVEPDAAVALNRRIAARCGADPAATDLARVLRLAGSLNLKGEPFRVRIAAETTQRYGASELMAALPAPKMRYRAPPAGRRIALGAPVDRIVVELAAAVPGMRNTALNRAAFRLALLGLDADRVSRLLTPVALAIGLDARETAATILSGATAGARIAAREPQSTSNRAHSDR